MNALRKATADPGAHAHHPQRQPTRLGRPPGQPSPPPSPSPPNHQDPRDEADLGISRGHTARLITECEWSRVGRLRNSRFLEPAPRAAADRGAVLLRTARCGRCPSEQGRRRSRSRRESWKTPQTASTTPATCLTSQPPARYGSGTRQSAIGGARGHRTGRRAPHRRTQSPVHPAASGRSGARSAPRAHIPATAAPDSTSTPAPAADPARSAAFQHVLGITQGFDLPTDRDTACVKRLQESAEKK